MGQQLELALRVEAGKLAQRVLDLLAVPELAGPPELVKIAASRHALDEWPEAGKGVCRHSGQWAVGSGQWKTVRQWKRIAWMDVGDLVYSCHCPLPTATLEVTRPRTR